MHVARRFHVPRRNEIEQTATLDAGKYPRYIGTLRIVQEFRTDKRRVPQHIAALLRRHHLPPIQAQRIAVDDMRTSDQRNAGEVHPEFLRHPDVHLVVDQPQRDLRDLSGELLDLDTVELIHVERDLLMNIQEAGARPAVHRSKDLELQQPQLAVGDDEKVAATAGRIEENQRAQLLVEFEQPVLVTFDSSELGP